MSKAYLFSVFDLNDYNYLKMPWRIVVEVLPPLSKAMPDSTFYILTDSKQTRKLREILERNNNVKLISLNTPVLRYPYKGLVQTIESLKKRFNIEVLVVFSGVNLHVWMRVAKLLEIKKLVIVFLTPIYTWRELAVIATKLIPRLLMYGTFVDFLDFVKLCYENVLARFVSSISRNIIKLTKDYDVHVIVMHYNAFSLFKSLEFKVHIAVPKLILVGKKQRSQWHSPNEMPRIAYFGPLILARGYDIVIELSRRLPKDTPVMVTLFSRSKLPNSLLSKLSSNNLNVVERFFENFEEIVRVAESHDLIVLPFRFVLSDIPLAVLELACSGTLVVTTPYSHVTKSCPNLVILDINELNDTGKVIELAYFAKKIYSRYHYAISWGDFVDLLKKVLRGED
ncbi:MAG: hypothetical protein QXE66_01960 [Desulfurococcaceae archaeon]